MDLGLLQTLEDNPCWSLHTADSGNQCIETVDNFIYIRSLFARKMQWLFGCSAKYEKAS